MGWVGWVRQRGGGRGWLSTGWRRALRYRLAHARHHVDKEGEARRVDGGHDDRVERRVGDVAVAGEALAPVHEAARVRVGGVGLDAVVEDEALVGELDVRLGPLGAPPLGEGLAVVRVRVRVRLRLRLRVRLTLRLRLRLRLRV